MLDHAVIAVRDLDIAIKDYHDLGFTVIRGGVHANRATHNALIAFADGTYLELLAGTGESPLPDLIDFSMLLQTGEGLVGFALRSDDLDADATRLKAHGVAVGEVIPGERRREDGTVIRWKLAQLAEGFAPFLIQDITPREWRVPADAMVTMHPNGAVGMRGVGIAVREMAVIKARYVTLLGISPQLISQNRIAIGNVILHQLFEGETSELQETLYAIHLIMEQPEHGRFPLERTHGVRFQQVALSDSL